MGKILIIKGANFSVNALDHIYIDDKKSVNASVNPTGSGVVNGTGRYNTGAQVSLTAVPNSGFDFKNWSDGNTNATRNIVVGATDINLIANFAKNSDISFNQDNVIYYADNSKMRLAAVSGYISTDYITSSGTGSKNVLEVGEKIYVKAQSGSETGNITVFITNYDNEIMNNKTVIKTYTSEQTKNGLTITADTKCEVYITNKKSLEPSPIARYTT